MGAYFDNAATTYPKPNAVYDYMDKFYRENGGNAGRGQYKLAATASRVISETRKMIQKVLQCENKEVIFAPSATLAMNMVLQGIAEPGMHFYISPFEHNAVTRTLHALEAAKNVTVHILPYSVENGYDLTAARQAFNTNKPDAVVISHASNVCGLIAPVDELTALVKEYGGITILDMAQTAGLVPLNVGSSNVDYAVFAGHKTLYGPIGIGGFVKKPEAKPIPILFGGTGIESALQDMPHDAPARYEMGSQNIHAISGLHAALTWFLENAEEIRTVEEKNHKRLLSILNAYSNITIVGPKDRRNCIGVVSCLFDDYSSDNIGDVLDRYEIAVRTGLHCAPIAHKTLKTFPAGTVRFSVGYFTSEEEFNLLDEALGYIEENA